MKIAIGPFLAIICLVMLAKSFSQGWAGVSEFEQNAIGWGYVVLAVVAAFASFMGRGGDMEEPSGDALFMERQYKTRRRNARSRARKQYIRGY